MPMFDWHPVEVGADPPPLFRSHVYDMLLTLNHLHFIWLIVFGLPGLTDGQKRKGAIVPLLRFIPIALTLDFFVILNQILKGYYVETGLFSGQADFSERLIYFHIKVFQIVQPQ